MADNLMTNTNSPNKMVAMILGAVLLLVGILGFIPGIAQNASPADANDTNDRELLGVFGVNAVHNIIHLLTGAILLGAALMNNGANARMVNMVLGAVYGLVALVGFARIDAIEQIVGGDVGIWWADPALHLILAGALLGVAFAVKEERPVARPPATGM